jgi:hypothetical protein
MKPNATRSKSPTIGLPPNLLGLFQTIEHIEVSETFTQSLKSMPIEIKNGGNKAKSHVLPLSRCGGSISSSGTATQTALSTRSGFQRAIARISARSLRWTVASDQHWNTQAYGTRLVLIFDKLIP